MFGIAVGIAGALMTVSMRMNAEDQSLLYSGLELSDASAIMERLDQAGIRYKMEAGGTAIFVNADQVVPARLLLSADGLPGQGSIGYEVFDNQDALGATSFVQNVNKLRALEGELARTITGMDAVASARVHLALPERRLFERDAAEPKASVWVNLRNDSLSRQHARTIRHAVAFAVPGLSTERVTIFDSEGRLLAGGDGEGDGPSMAVQERQHAIEDDLRRKIITVVERLVGPGNVTAEVSAEVDFNRVTESAEIFDPEARALISSEVIEETNNERDSEGLRDPASASENVPDGGADDADGPTSQSSIATNRLQEKQNWEVSRTTRTLVSEVGNIQRVSVAVAVDGVTTADEEGNPVYTPRSEEEMAQIAALVRSAIGFDEARNDSVEVVNIRFARTLPDTVGSGAPSAMSFDKTDIMRAAELGVLLIVAILIIFLVARPIAKGAMEGFRGAPSMAGVPKIASGGKGGNAALPSPDGSRSGREVPGMGTTGGGIDPKALAEELIEDGLDIEQFDGQVKMSSINKVSEVVTSHPDESVSIIRNWLHDDLASSPKEPQAEKA